MRELTAVFLVTVFTACATPAADVSGPSVPPAYEPIPTPNGMQITVVPAVLDEPGIYWLAADTVFAGGDLESPAAIIIASNDVVLNLAGRRLSNLGINPHAIGVLVQNVSRTTIQNGRIEGFHVGISVLDMPEPSGAGHHIRGVELVGNAYKAIDFFGNDSAIDHNVIEETGGWVNEGSITYIHAISAIGRSITITQNEIRGSTNAGEGLAKETVGIACGRCPLGVIEDNRVESDPTRCLFSHGVWVSGDTEEDAGSWTLVKNNRLEGLYYGVGYGHISSGYLQGNSFVRVAHPLYNAASWEFVDSGAHAEISDPFPDATWIDLGGNVRPPDREDAWADYESRCPALFE